jgi:hypothetical protein
MVGGVIMPTFQLTLAHDVSVYGTVEVEAENYAAAIEAARADLDSSGAIWGDITDVEWGSSYRFRIVDIYSIGDNGMDQMPLRKNIDLTGPDDCEPFSAEQVLANVTAARITT